MPFAPKTNVVSCSAHGSYVRTIRKTGITSAVVYQSMFTIKHPLKDMTLQCNVLWQDSEIFPTKIRQIVLCTHDQFGWRLQNKTTNQGNSVLLRCANIELSITVWFSKRTYQRNHKLFDVFMQEMFPNLANGHCIEVSYPLVGVWQ